MDADESSSERNIIVNGIVDFNESPHKNKKAYSIDLVYTTGTQNYNSKIGINIFPLPVGKYTIIMEYYFPEDTNISLLAGASTAIITKQTSTNFPNYTKLLVQFDQRTKDTPDYLYFNISGSATTSTNPEGYLIFYGIKDLVDSVPPEIYDRVLESSMDLDLNNHSMINAREDYFHIKGYYKSSVNNKNILFGNNVYALITTDGVGNDNKFRLIIRGHEHYTSNINLFATDNSKFQRFMNFRKNLFLPSGGGFVAGITHDSHATIPPKFIEAKFFFKFFRI